MKRPVRDVHCLRPSVAEIKNNWNYTFTLQTPKRRFSKKHVPLHVPRFVKNGFLEII